MRRQRKPQRWLATTCVAALLVVNQTAGFTVQAQELGIRLAQSDAADDYDAKRTGNRKDDRRRGEHRPGNGAENDRSHEQRRQSVQQHRGDGRPSSTDRRQPEAQGNLGERGGRDDRRHYSREQPRADAHHWADRREDYRHDGDRHDGDGYRRDAYDRSGDRRDFYHRDDHRRADYGRDGYRREYSQHYYFVPRYKRHVYYVPPYRTRHYRDIVIVRPYGHWYHGYGRHYDDDSAYTWLAFTAISLGILSLLSESQQRAHEQAQIYATTAPVGQPIYWRDQGAQGSVTPLRDGYSESGRYCREFQQRVTIGGRSEDAYGTACRQPDGAWQIVDSGD